MIRRENRSGSAQAVAGVALLASALRDAATSDGARSCSPIKGSDYRGLSAGGQPFSSVSTNSIGWSVRLTTLWLTPASRK